MKLTREQRIFLDGLIWGVLALGVFVLFLVMISGCASEPTRAHKADRELRMRLKNYDHRYQSWALLKPNARKQLNANIAASVWIWNQRKGGPTPVVPAEVRPWNMTHDHLHRKAKAGWGTPKRIWPWCWIPGWEHVRQACNTPHGRALARGL